MRTRPIVTALAAIVLSTGVASGQQSASYRITQRVLNQGGAPVAGVVPDSTGFALSQLSIGESVAVRRLTGGTYAMDTGFGAPWLPPGEVDNLRFVDDETLQWDPQRTSYHYRLLRGAPFSLTCEQPRIDALETNDPEVPQPGQGFAYLVVGVSRLGEEGSAGNDSAGVRRRFVSCP